VFAFCISGVLDTDEKVDIFAGNILVLVVMFAVGVFLHMGRPITGGRGLIVGAFG